MTLPTDAPGATWRLATVTKIKEETSTVRTLVLDVAGWNGHVAGQYVDVRLIGSNAKRTFSIASAPDDPRVALTIERLPGGKLSSHLCGDAGVGDRFELRGPMGDRFVWRESDAEGAPLLFVAGGSGIAPLMSMLRHRARVMARRGARLGGARLLFSSRSWEGIIYRDELARLAEADPTLEVTHTLTRNAPANWSGYHRRIDRAMLEEIAWRPWQRPRNYVCGPDTFVEDAANTLVDLGHDPASVLTERFVPTGSQNSTADPSLRSG